MTQVHVLDDCCYLGLRDKVTGEWRRLHKEELILRTHSDDEVEMGKACSTYRGQGRCVQCISGETEEEH